MKAVLRSLIILFVLAAGGLGGVVYLAQIPSPDPAHVEKTISNDQFPR